MAVSANCMQLSIPVLSCNLHFSCARGTVAIVDPQNLLIDADDTLWENNIYFERVIQEARALLDCAGADSLSFRAELDETERRRIPWNGYGTVNFTSSLVETFIRFLPADSDQELPARVRQLSLAILDHPLEIFEGVLETLDYLASRHSLFLITKGDWEEQSAKIRASNLQGYFRTVEILPEKNTRAYSQLLDRHGLECSCSWMIGNSPRSDINPALAAGMNAVYIPHKHTWTLEHEEPAEHPSLIELGKFSDLRLHF
jgi:putative hydrolase of the HAD superfamily